jgi:RND family efflux transporter MFP subunit
MLEQILVWMQRWVALIIVLGEAGAAPALAEELAGFDCLIEPQTVVEVSTREEGILQELLVGRGDMVSEGQAIASLNRDVEQATVELAKARAEREAEIQELRETLAFAQRDKDRIDQLSSAKAISFTEQDKATTDARRAELRLQQALEEQTIARLELDRATRILENRTVRSPVDGVVVERMMSPGESAENRPIVKIAKIDPLNVEIIVPVDYYGSIRLGMQAEVMPRYPGASALTATVTVVDRVVDAASDTFGVRLLLPNPNHEVPGGVRCGIRFLEAPEQPAGRAR